MKKKVTLTLGGKNYELAVSREKDRLILTGALDGEPLDELDAEVAFDLPWILLRTDGSVHRCAVARDTKGVWVSLRGRSVFLEAAGAHGGQAAPSEIAEDEIRAPMTGTVLDVKVKPGDAVRQGDVVAVMEAMKMEYRLEAAIDGTVERVECKTGDMIDVGTLMIQLAAAESAPE
jgi:biotin carboxyl carrier protein